MKIKVCGLTRLEDASLACELGAWALGFIFYPKSPRYINPEDAAKMIQSLRAECSNMPILVGVFVNESIESVEAIKSLVGLDLVQLHGDESVSDCESISPLIKAFRPSSRQDIEGIKSYLNTVDYLLVDAAVKGVYGGSGQLSDWSLSKEVKELGVPLLLSGGLNPDNIEKAWEDVQPFALDLSSGIESEPGVKDHDRLKKLFKIGHKL